jgi:hypothetical protein
MSNEHHDEIILPATVAPATLAGSNAIYNKISDPLQAIQMMGEMIWGSGMFGCVKPEQGMVLAMTCLAEGKAPLELAKTYHIIEGKLSMRADAMLGRFLSSGGKVKWLVRNDKEVKALWTHDGNEIEIGVTVEEMKANGVALSKTGQMKDNWKRFPRQMLTARCISEGVRLLAPQIVSGIYTPEEVQDFGNGPISQPARISHEPVMVAVAPREIADPKGEVVSRLEELLGKYEPKATEYLIGKGYIKQGSTFRDLDAMTAQRVLSNPGKIIGILEGLS